MLIGIENIIFNYWMVSILLLYILAMLPIVRRSFKEKHEYKWNNAALLIVMLTIAIFLSIPIRVATSNEYSYNFIVSFPWNFFFLVFAGAWIVVVAITGIFTKKNKPDSIKTEKSSERQEYKRKVVHVFAVGYLISFLFAFLFNFLVYSIPSIYVITDEFFQIVYYLTFIQDPDVMGISFLIFLFLGTFIVQLDSELIGLNWPNVNFPLKKLLIETNRDAENKAFGTHLHMIAGFAISSILILVFSPAPYLATAAIFAAITISIFGDMFAALIGKLFGKHKWSFFPEKSIEGTIGGAAISFFLGFIFIGLIGALIGTLVIVVTDIFLPKITSLCDNLLNPLLISISFVILIQFEPLVTPMAKITLIARDLVITPELNYSTAEGFWGTFPCVLLTMAIPVIIGLLIALKYRKSQIKYLFTGNKKHL